MWIFIYFVYKLNFQPVSLNAVNSRVPLPQDCDHVSQTAEEFYTVRCQVADMKNIYVSPADLLPPGAQRSSCQPLFYGVAGVPGRGDHQGHARGRQHVHLLTVRQEGPR